MFQDIRTLMNAAHKHTHTHIPSVAGSSCGRVSVLFGFLCHSWLWAIMSTSSADLQGWGGSCRTELSWLSIWREEAAYGNRSSSNRGRNTPLTLCISPLPLPSASRSQRSMIISLYDSRLHQLGAHWSNCDRNWGFGSRSQFCLEVHEYNWRARGVLFLFRRGRDIIRL